MYICCSWILFSVIIQKRVKHSMTCVTVWRWWWSLLVCFNKAFQLNALNRHLYITTIVSRLNLVWKADYYTFWIITKAQHVLVFCTTRECLSADVATVVRTIFWDTSEVLCPQIKMTFPNKWSIQILLYFYHKIPQKLPVLSRRDALSVYPFWFLWYNIVMTVSFSYSILSLMNLIDKAPTNKGGGFAISI